MSKHFLVYFKTRLRCSPTFAAHCIGAGKIDEKSIKRRKYFGSGIRSYCCCWAQAEPTKFLINSRPYTSARQTLTVFTCQSRHSVFLDSPAATFGEIFACS